MTEYQIRVKGLLDPKLAAWFGEFTISYTTNGDTLLTGMIIDQAALHGVLGRCRSLGMTLISMYPVEASIQSHYQGENNEQDDPC